MPNFSETRLGYRDPIFAILNATSGDVLNATLMQAPSTYIQNPGKVTRGTGSEMYLSHHIKGDFGGARCAKGDCCYAARFDGATMTWIRIFEDIGAQYNNYNCRSNAVPSSDGNQVFVGGRNLVAMLKASDGSVIVSKPITNCSEVRGLAVIGSDLYVVGRSIYMGIGVDSVAVSSPIAGPTNAKYWSFILKFSTTATGLTATAGTWIGSDEPVVTEVWSVNQAYNVSGYPDAVVVAMEQFGSIFKTGTGFVSDTFMTTAGSSTVRFSVGVSPPMDPTERLTDALAPSGLARRGSLDRRRHPKRHRRNPLCRQVRHPLHHRQQHLRNRRLRPLLLRHKRRPHRPDLRRRRNRSESGERGDRQNHVRAVGFPARVSVASVGDYQV